MIPVNPGDLGESVRRAFAVTGRVPLNLDEVIVPVAITRDLTLPAYAQEPAYAMGSFDLQGNGVDNSCLQMRVPKDFQNVVEISEIHVFTDGVGGGAQPVYLDRGDALFGQTPTLLSTNLPRTTNPLDVSPLRNRALIVTTLSFPIVNMTSPRLALIHKHVDANRLDSYGVRRFEGLVLYPGDTLFVFEVDSGAHCSWDVVAREYAIRP